MKEIIVTPKIEKSLKILGEQIRMARLRRNFSMDLIARRAEISRPTLMKIENGCPGVAIGSIAKVLQAIGNLDSDLTLVAKDDVTGRTYQDLNMKTPHRSKKR